MATQLSATASPTAPTLPFLKWAGGKRGLVASILPLMPTSFGTYHEPFLGGGALAFARSPERAQLSDINGRLIATYEAVRDAPEAVIDALRTFQNSAESYYEHRRLLSAPAPKEVTAARFIFLNKTGFNGLFRENKRGEFNVPYGNNPDARFLDASGLRACSKALQSATLRHDDFESVRDRAQPGDVCYFDPPYAPLTATSSFTSYHASGFGLADQVRLRDLAVMLKERGVHVVLSNSSAPLIYELYAGFQVHEVNARRAINSKGDKRGAVKELLIT